MNFLEKDLEEIIYEADKADLHKKGLHINGKLLRQLRIGNYGIADLVEVVRQPAFVHENEIISYGKLFITVYELKKEKINVSALLQAIGYVKGIDRYLSKRNFNFEVEYNIKLIGKEIDKNSTFSYLSDYVATMNSDETREFLCNYTYDYNIDGISFKQEHNYKLTDEGF